MYRKLAPFFLVLLFALIPGCGSGGSSTASHSAKALAKVKTSGLLTTGETLGAIMLTISVPPGVTVSIDPATNKPAVGVVTLVGATDSSMVFQYLTYTAPTATASGSLGFMVVNAQGFGPVEYLSVQLDVSTGYFPVAGDFVVSNFAVAGITNYAQTLVQNPTVSVDIN